MTGVSNASSSAAMIRSGKAADEDRMNRMERRAMVSRLAGARLRIAWCIVGTAVYQVG